MKTLKEKIEVMQHYLNGKEIRITAPFPGGMESTYTFQRSENGVDAITWNWSVGYDYELEYPEQEIEDLQKRAVKACPYIKLMNECLKEVE